MEQVEPICYLCDEVLSGPAIPRTLEDGTGPVLLCVDCWEACAGCCQPIKVFEPIRAFSAGSLPLVMRDRGDRLLVVLDGVRLHLCENCDGA